MGREYKIPFPRLETPVGGEDLVITIGEGMGRRKGRVYGNGGSEGCGEAEGATVEKKARESRVES